MTKPQANIIKEIQTDGRITLRTILLELPAVNTG